MKKILAIIGLMGFIPFANCQDTTHSGSEALAQKLANPVGDVISLPFQNNFHFGVGPGDGSRWSMNIQPVIPVRISKNYNLISRVILPITSQREVFGKGSGSQTGIGDLAYSAFISPATTKPGGWVWGVGPIINLPTASDKMLGLRKFGAGPTAVFLKPGRFTYGMLVWNLWAGNNSIGFLQPFFTRTFPNGASVGTSFELTQNWKSDRLSGLWGLNAGKVFRINNQTFSAGTGPLLFFGNDPGRPEWGWRLGFGLVFPK